jgi:hypothetical protein
MREHAWQTFANGLRKIRAAYRGESQGQQLLRAIFIGATHNRPPSYACQQAERKGLPTATDLTAFLYQRDRDYCCSRAALPPLFAASLVNGIAHMQATPHGASWVYALSPQGEQPG